MTEQIHGRKIHWRLWNPDFMGRILLDISVVLDETPSHGCPLMLFPRHLFARIGLYQFLFRNRMVSSPSKTKELLLGKRGKGKGNKSLEKLSNYRGQLMWWKEKVLGSKYQRQKTKDVEGCCLEHPPEHFTCCCHLYILQRLKFLNIWLLAKFAENVKPAEGRNIWKRFEN